VNDSDLRRVSLRRAELATATLSGILAEAADFSGAHLSRTVFARCRDLHRARGLDALEYMSPSCVDLETLRECLAGLPDEFLVGMGVERRSVAGLAGLAPA
jgi:uncharacterized protein YjbI with pentapeptide repeats